MIKPRPGDTIIVVEGGAVQDVLNPPTDRQTFVKDYDCEGCEEDNEDNSGLDENGDHYHLARWYP